MTQLTLLMLSPSEDRSLPVNLAERDFDFHTLTTMDPKALAQIPDCLVKVLQEADEAGALPEAIAEKLRELGMI